MSVLVVSGTGTGVGKTVVTAAVAALAAARGTAVAVVKPAQTGVGPGEPGDLDDVRRLAGVTDLHEHARFPDPLSPAAAARRSGRPLRRPARRARARVRELAQDRGLVLVEGAGGLLVRYDEDGATIADLARDLAAPVLVVAEPSLGTLNHTALTLEAMAHRGLALAGLVLGSWPAEPDLACRSNVRDLETLAARPLAGALRAGAGDLPTRRVPARGPRRAGARRSAAPSMRQTSAVPTPPQTEPALDTIDILDVARAQVLEGGRGLDESQVLSTCSSCPTTPCPTCSPSPTRCGCAGAAPRSRSRASCRSRPAAAPRTATSARSPACSPRRCARPGSTSPSLVKAAKETAATGATEFCIVAAVRGPDERLMAQMREGVAAIRKPPSTSTSPPPSACSRRSRSTTLAEMGVHRYNHNLETARSYFPQVVTTHTWEERWSTLTMVRDAGMEVCCGGIVGMGETLRAARGVRRPARRAGPDEVPLNFLNPRPGTPFGDLPVMAGPDALRTIAAFRLALPRTILRYAGGREITLGDLGTRDGHARRHQRCHRRQLPDDAGSRPPRTTSRCSATSACRSRRCRRRSEAGRALPTGRRTDGDNLRPDIVPAARRSVVTVNDPDRPAERRPTARSPRAPRRAERSDHSHWNWLLVIPLLATLYPPLYNRVKPLLFDIPFFYWYQLAAIAHRA